MAPEQPQYQVDSSAPAYMLTYGDMVTLLLTFFVMLYGISLMDQKQRQTQTQGEPLYSRIAAGIANRFSARPLVGGGGAEGSSLIATNPDGSRMIRMLNERLQQAGSGELGRGKVEEIPGGFKITLPSELLFDFASADLRPEGYSTLSVVAEMIAKNEGYLVDLLGHTDNVPVRTLSDEFKDNLELSTMRACSVARFLSSTGGVQPGRIIATGMGEWHPVDPSADSSSETNRRRNRRVEILLIESGYMDAARRSAVRSPAEIPQGGAPSAPEEPAEPGEGLPPEDEAKGPGPEEAEQLEPATEAAESPATQGENP